MVQDQLRNSAYDKAITRVSLHQAYNMLQQTPRWSKGGGGGGDGCRGKGYLHAGQGCHACFAHLVCENRPPLCVFALSVASMYDHAWCPLKYELHPSG